MSQSKKQSSSHNYGPGNVLRNKREEYEWSIEAVADALHLPVSHISALEDDRYEDLPGSTYVIGYWRSYARLLGIDIEDTIEANKRNVLEEEYEDVVMASQEGMHAHGSKSGAMGVLFTIFLLLVLVAGGLWFAWKQGLVDFSSLNNSGEESVQVDSDTEQPNIEEVEPEPVMVAVKPAVNDPDVVLAKPEESSYSEQQTTGDQEAKKPDTEETVSEQEAEENVVIEESEEVIVPKEEKSQVAKSESKVGQVGNQPVVSEPVDEGEITLILEQDSWLDVRDRTLKRLIYRSETRDKTIELKGEPPFYVYIGTPSGVKVRYLGKEIPFEVHKSGLFARFKVGEKRS